MTCTPWRGIEHTCGVGQLVLLPLDPVLQCLCLSTLLLDARLHRLRRHIAGADLTHGSGCRWKSIDDRTIDAIDATVRKAEEEGEILVMVVLVTGSLVE